MTTMSSSLIISSTLICSTSLEIISVFLSSPYFSASSFVSSFIIWRIFSWWASKSSRWSIRAWSSLIWFCKSSIRRWVSLLRGISTIAWDCSSSKSNLFSSLDLASSVSWLDFIIAITSSMLLIAVIKACRIFILCFATFKS